MTERETLIGDIAIIDNDIQEMSKTKREKYCRLRDICCPFEVGNVVKCRDGAGERKLIISITPKETEPYYGLRLSKIKKNGEPYQQVGHAYFFEYPFVLAD